MPDVSSLYPQPPQPNALSDPTKILGLLPVLSQMAVGQQYQKAMNPDGTTNWNALQSGIASTPAAALAAPQAQSNILAQRGAEIANNTAWFQLNAAQSTYAMQALSALAVKDSVSANDIRNVQAGLVRNGIPPEVASAVGDSLINSPDITQAVREMKARVAGAAATAGRVPGPPGPGGQPTSVNPYYAGMSPAPTATGLEPGTPEYMQASQGQYAKDQQSAANWQQRALSMQEAIPLAEKLGPQGAGFGGNVKNELSRIGVALGADPTIASNYEQLRKYLLRDAMVNGDIGSNDKMYNQIASNPNIDLTQASILDLAKMQLAQYRIKQTQILEAQAQGVPRSDYLNWSTKWNSAQDPVAYEFDLMPKNKQQAYVAQLKKDPTGEAYSRFAASLRAAHAHGLTMPGGPPGMSGQ